MSILMRTCDDCPCGGVGTVWAQHIYCGKAQGGFLEFTAAGVADDVEETTANQRRMRRWYRRRETAASGQHWSDAILRRWTFRTIDEMSQGHRPTHTYEATGTNGPVHDADLFSNNFAPQNPVGVFYGSITSITGDTQRNLHGQGVIGDPTDPDTYLDKTQTISELQMVEDTLYVLFAGITSRNWSGFPSTPETTDAEIKVWGGARREWGYDESRYAYVEYIEDSLDVSALPEPSSYSEQLVPNNQTGDYGSWVDYPDIFYVPECQFPDYGADQLEVDHEHQLFSGWEVSHTISPPISYPNRTSNVLPFLAAVRTRFSVIGRSFNYWIGRARWCYIGEKNAATPTFETYWDPVEVISTGTIAVGDIVEIPFAETFPEYDGDEEWPVVTDGRLQMGHGTFAILDETPAEWSARTGHALA